MQIKMNEMDKPLILIVEDDHRLALINRRALTASGYRVKVAPTLADARILLKEEDPDIMLLDVKLPDGLGFDFCLEVRDSTSSYIIFLTSVTGHEGEMNGLLAGGDDYLRKPYAIDLLRLRIDKGLSQRKSASKKIVKGPLVLDIVSARVTLDDEDLLLTPKEFALLRLLMEKEGEPIQQNKLFEEAWGQSAVGDASTIKYHVSKVRKKIADSGYTIVAYYGEGYCFERA